MANKTFLKEYQYLVIQFTETLLTLLHQGEGQGMRLY